MTIARGNVRCGSIASPAENVTYCQPSYAHNTPIIPSPMPDQSAGVKDAGQIAIEGDAAPRRETMSTALMTSSAPTLSAVLQFCTSALRRVLRTLIAHTSASNAIAVAFWPIGPIDTNCCTYEPEATASVAAEPLAITRKNVQP